LSPAPAVAPIALGSTRLDWSRTFLMGVINATPDSFSDGGRFLDPAAAVAQGLALAAAGADLLDVGGESTRPGADPVPVEEEIRRVVPVIQGLRAACGIPISIDTTKAAVAEAACAAGAAVVNDVSGLAFEPDLARVAARAGAALVLMHRRGTPRTMQDRVDYDDLIGEVTAGLAASLDRAVAAGVPRERILLDPGIGFGKDLEGNLRLLRCGHHLRGALGRPVLVGPSRKSFIGKLTGAPVEARLPGTLAACVLARLFGADVLRVHDVAEVRQALQVTDALIGLAPDRAATLEPRRD
jgi:dihydropteroate synthase